MPLSPQASDRDPSWAWEESRWRAGADLLRTGRPLRIPVIEVSKLAGALERARGANRPRSPSSCPPIPASATCE